MSFLIFTSDLHRILSQLEIFASSLFWEWTNKLNFGIKERPKVVFVVSTSAVQGQFFSNCLWRSFCGFEESDRTNISQFTVHYATLQMKKRRKLQISIFFFFTFFQEKRPLLNACLIFSFFLACTLRQCVFSSRYTHFVVDFNSYLITTPIFI